MVEARPSGSTLSRLFLGKEMVTVDSKGSFKVS